MRTAVRLLILCLFIRFPYAFCAEVEDDRSLCSATSRATLSNPVICFAKTHADLMGQEGIKSFGAVPDNTIKCYKVSNEKEPIK